MSTERRAEHIMGMPAADTSWTVALLDALPDDGARREIIDGELFVTPAPSDVHQLVAAAFWRRLWSYTRPSLIARAIMSPADVRKPDRARNRVQPDVFVVRLLDGLRPPYPYDLRDLLLVVEVASPGNPILDYQVKREVYLAHGVPEYWIVNAEARVVSRWRSSEHPGEEFVHAITWHPAGMSEPLVLDLPALFDEALG